MKYHRPLLQAVSDILLQTFTTAQYAEKLLEQAFKSHPQWGKRDRAFIAETVFDCVRWWRFYNVLLGENETNTHLSAEEVIKIIGVHLTLKENSPIDNSFFNHLPSVSTLREKEIHLGFAERAAYPEWLDNIAAASLGKADWQNEATALNSLAPIVLRCNTLKISVERLQALLLENNISTYRTSLAESALVVEGRVNLLQLDAFKTGLFEVQDAGSQCIAPFLKIDAFTQNVIDACAGAGGKTLHIADLMRNKGRITALDIHGNKLRELETRAKRQGVTSIITQVIDPEKKIIGALKKSADAVLLDVPCSGLGVLRRHPDTKWKLTPQILADLHSVQAEILQSYSHMARVGGCVVYATCSILPSENQDQVAAFLNRNDSFKLEESQTVSPFKEGFDGFYMARLRRVR